MLATLEEFGLSKNEAKLYLCLIKQNRVTASELHKATGIHRRNVYDTLDRLMEKGLVFQISAGKSNFYQAVNPEKLKQILEEKNNNILRIIPDLSKEFNSQIRKEEVYIYQGVEGFKNHQRDVLEIKQDYYAIGSKGFWFDKRIEPFTHSFLQEVKKRKIKIHHIFDHEISLLKSDLLEQVPGKHKFLPPEFSSNLTTCVYGDRFVSYTGRGISDLGDSIKLFITVSPQVAEGQRKWFKCLWDMLP